MEKSCPVCSFNWGDQTERWRERHVICHFENPEGSDQPHQGSSGDDPQTIASTKRYRFEEPDAGNDGTFKLEKISNGLSEWKEWFLDSDAGGFTCTVCGQNTQSDTESRHHLQHHRVNEEQQRIVKADNILNLVGSTEDDSSSFSGKASFEGVKRGRERGLMQLLAERLLEEESEWLFGKSVWDEKPNPIKGRRYEAYLCGDVDFFFSVYSQKQNKNDYDKSRGGRPSSDQRQIWLQHNGAGQRGGKREEKSPNKLQSETEGERLKWGGEETGDVGWGCGYRNIMILCSHLLGRRCTGGEHGCPYGHIFDNLEDVPNIETIQRGIEQAWKDGFDPQGAAELNHEVVGTRKWIGTAEACSLLRSMAVRCNIRAYRLDGDGSHNAILESVIEYFASHAPGGERERQARRAFFDPAKGSTVSFSHAAYNKYCTGLPPLYFQHQGHSRTIVGVCVRYTGKSDAAASYASSAGQKAFLLIFDPSHYGVNLRKSLSEIRGKTWQRRVKRSVATLRKSQFEILSVNACRDPNTVFREKKLRLPSVLSSSGTADCSCPHTCMEQQHPQHCDHGVSKAQILLSPEEMRRGRDLRVWL